MTSGSTPESAAAILESRNQSGMGPSLKRQARAMAASATAVTSPRTEAARIFLQETDTCRRTYRGFRRIAVGPEMLPRPLGQLFFLRKEST